MKKKYFFLEFSIFKSLLQTRQTTASLQANVLVLTSALFYNVLLNLIQLCWLFSGADSSLRSGSETTQTNGTLHKSNVRKAQLATNWPYSSQFYAQFTSWRKQAKWNVRSELNQMQTEEEEGEACLLGAKLDLHIKPISQQPAVWWLLFRFWTNENPPLATWDGFSHGQSQTEW